MTTWHNYKNAPIITIAITPGTPPQAATVKENGDTVTPTLQNVPIILTAISAIIPENTLKKALLKGFLFFAIKFKQVKINKEIIKAAK